MPSIPANELKARDVTAIEQALAENTEAIVSVRGKDKYVVMSFDQYPPLGRRAGRSSVPTSRPSPSNTTIGWKPNSS